jgi:predicted nucleic acid-binding protein
MADRYLVDTSVLARASHPEVGDRLEALALAGRLWTCRIVDLETVYGADAIEARSVAAWRRALPEAPVTSAVMDRALDVLVLLAAAGWHRAARPADVMVAAAAEAAELVVLHYGGDFPRIAAVTGQRVVRVARPGLLDG